MAAPLLKLAATQLVPQLPEHGGRIAGAVLVALVAAPLLLLLLASGVSGNQCGALSSANAELSPFAKKAIPKWLVPVYTDAARKFRLGREGWAYLAAVDLVENGYEGERGSQTSYANAQGPMQFLPSTWARYKQDGDGDGRADIQDHRDAIFGAANYLRASGAPQWGRALLSYNHSRSYVAKVTAIALDYVGEGSEVATRFVATGPAGCSCTTSAPGDGGVVPKRAPSSLPERAPKLRWPTATRTISSPFGMRWGRLHAGVDIPVPTGTPLHAAAAGRVTQAGWFGGYGNYSCIQHARALSTCYGHQSRLRVHAGQSVSAGQIIGLSGNTGHSFGAHVHFEVRLGAGFAGRPVDPRPYLAGARGPTATPVTGGACSGTSPVSAIEGASLLWPTARTRGRVIGLPYQGTHTLGNWQSDNAIDIAVPVGTPLVAVADGVICHSCGFGGSIGSGLGRFDGLRLTLNTRANQVFYKHIKRFAPGIRPGAHVRRGQVIGYSWSANGVPHLHIGVRSGDPRQLFGIGGGARTSSA
jgi:murein DD-endopeptidase MepM/ murein hydrolase activator NlpD